MRAFLSLTLAGLLGGLAHPALAQSPEKAPTVDPAVVQAPPNDRAIITRDGKASVNKDGKICKSMVKTGSRLPTAKVCKTPEEWEQQREMSKDELDELSRRNLSVNRIAGT